jgi:sarcosine oxidase gamma subunit
MMSTTRITPHPAAGDLEFVTYGPVVPAVLPAAPGAVLSDGTGPVLLHVAPDRWFAPAASAATRTRLEALRDDGTLVDVEGKWCRLDVTGARATAILSASLDIAAVLSDRDCAAVTLFDCPALVLRTPDGYAVWTQRSYRMHLLSECQRLAGDGR